MPSLTSKRLAGSSCGGFLINGIAVSPLEDDAPILVEEAVCIALERSRFVDAPQIRVGGRGRVVRLTGLVKSDVMRDAAEADAWYVFGVDDVINKIEVRPYRRTILSHCWRDAPLRKSVK
ncbi:BON domain-containing protein [Chelativorans xinjiangense]|uniref:BON domain-containing protein n=1 Tax=Chelativorans xinjiangense TaxID=2681485 RepID=UPI0013574F57|nr:BON domain-containing protein [Chelativorans xinjiangense]